MIKAAAMRDNPTVPTTAAVRIGTMLQSMTGTHFLSCPSANLNVESKVEQVVQEMNGCRLDPVKAREQAFRIRETMSKTNKSPSLTDLGNFCDFIPIPY
jgi:hypothetical protein